MSSCFADLLRLGVKRGDRLAEEHSAAAGERVELCQEEKVGLFWVSSFAVASKIHGIPYKISPEMFGRT